MNKRTIGADYEKQACDHLIKQGYQILERNYRCRIGELDIVAKDGQYLVFVEVKFRSNVSMGNALEAVNWRKQRIIRKVARYYLMASRKGEGTPCRFDVLGITGREIALIKDAF